MRYYAGIGSRQTPPEICSLMTRIAAKLEQDGWCLSSGGAKGADTAFESGVQSLKTIYRPEFRENWATRAQEVMDVSHWGRCGDFARKAHSRNAAIVFGGNLETPVRFVCCWTRDALAIGGTATAIKLAIKYQIPVKNLGDESIRHAAEKWLEEK